MIRHLPNLLSAARLLAAPVAAWAILAGHDTAALILFVAASFSDLADGFIARRWGLTSQSGAWLDPIADKLLMLLCFLALWKAEAVPLWLVVLVIARDAGIMGGALLAKLCGLPLRIAPLAIGKATTAALAVFVGARLLLLAFDVNAPHYVTAGSYTAASFILLSGALYALVFLKMLFGGRHAA
jgi:cardiolipin synthase (CMP-forming)